MYSLILFLVLFLYSFDDDVPENCRGLTLRQHDSGSGSGWMFLWETAKICYLYTFLSKEYCRIVLFTVQTQI